MVKKIIRHYNDMQIPILIKEYHIMKVNYKVKHRKKIRIYSKL